MSATERLMDTRAARRWVYTYVAQEIEEELDVGIMLGDQFSTEETRMLTQVTREMIRRWKYLGRIS